jgi:MFS family permease
VALGSRLRGLPVVVWGLGFVSLLTDAASDMVVPLLPALLAGVGGGALALGVMEGVAELTSAALKIGSGAAVDRGRRAGPLVVIGYGVAAIARPLYAIASAPWHAIALRSLDRAGKGLRSAPRDGILAASVGAKDRALAFGLHRGMDNLGAVVGGLLAFMLLGVAGLTVEQVLLLSVVPGVISTVIAAVVTRNALPPAETKDRPSGAPPPLPSATKRALVVIGAFSLAASTDTFLIAHLQRQGLAVKWLPIAWISLQLAKALLNVPGGALADRIGPRNAIAVGWSVYAVTYALFAWSPNAIATWCLFTLYGVFYGLTEGAEKALVAEACPALARGRAFGLLAAITGLMLLPANVVFGLLYERSPAWAFGAGGAIAAASVLLLALALPSAPTELEPSADR